MDAARFKQVLKNSVYRTIGETAAAIGASGNGDRSLRVLMYHKVNDLPGNPLTMPVSIFDQQPVHPVLDEVWNPADAASDDRSGPAERHSSAGRLRVPPP